MPPVRTSSTKVAFVKMHGAGNDFIVLNALNRLPFDLSEFAIRACDRHFGIGADGVMVIEPSKRAEYAVSYFNADGSRAVCGNGTRCVARYIYTERLVAPDRRDFEIETDDGVIPVEIIGKGDRIRTVFRAPQFDGPRIPTSVTGEFIDKPIDISGETFYLTAVGLGNPHGVIFVDDVASVDVPNIGRAIHEHALFPKKADIEFVQIRDRETVDIRIFERGVGETLACGTGSCAVLAAGVKTNRLDHAITLRSPGGEFQVSWNQSAEKMFLTGPTQEVYRAEIDFDQVLGVKLLSLGSGIYPAVVDTNFGE